jgi:hypothetical protein
VLLATAHVGWGLQHQFAAAAGLVPGLSDLGRRIGPRGRGAILLLLLSGRVVVATRFAPAAALVLL